MHHKTIKIKHDARVYRVRLHSIDGKLWLARSPRSAARVIQDFTKRKLAAYASAGACFARNVDDDL